MPRLRADRRRRQRMHRPTGIPHPLEILPVRLVQVARALVEKRRHQAHRHEALDAAGDRPGRPGAQGVMRRLECHR